MRPCIPRKPYWVSLGHSASSRSAPSARSMASCVWLTLGRLASFTPREVEGDYGLVVVEIAAPILGVGLSGSGQFTLSDGEEPLQFRDSPGQ